MRSTALILAAVCLVFSGIAAAKKPVSAAATATLSGSWSDGKLSISGCGYDISIDGGVKVVYTHPDATTETWYTGIFWADGAQCLDNNYIPATDAGVWTVDTYQAGVQVAETTVTVG